MAKKLSRTKQTKSRTRQTGKDITQVEYGRFQEGFDFFNAALFENELRPVLVTLQRKGNSKGYYSPDRFNDRTRKARADELALNPDHFTGSTDREILSTLVHEMVHHWQSHHGQHQSRKGYHNREWAVRMQSIGLHPSHNGAVGGKETGQRMTHYIVTNGPYDRAYARLRKTGFKLNWESTELSVAGKGVRSSKIKVTCDTCGQNAWGKPDLDVRCNVCNVVMTNAGSGAKLA
jgi:ribosomal protein S27E/predicted SprT family Zn-dependent metalloprotease